VVVPVVTAAALSIRLDVKGVRVTTLLLVLDECFVIAVFPEFLARSLKANVVVLLAIFEGL